MAAVLVAALVGAEQPIDGFQSEGEDGSPRWVASEGTPPGKMVRYAGDWALQLKAPFAQRPDIRRAVVDRQVEMNLAGAGTFTLQLSIDTPAAVGHVTLYFHSQTGWYACGRALGSEKTQTLHFARGAFGTEDDPAGWDRIDRIRIALWRARDVDAVAHVQRLCAVEGDVAMIVPRAEGGETRVSRDTAERMARMLRESGLSVDRLFEEDLPAGALGARRVAVLPYNPHLAEGACRTLEQFIAGGGKLFVGYVLPARLADDLGLRAREYYRPEQEGGLAEIRFSADDRATVPGLPASTRQASWNIHVPEPRGHNARPIGQWFDRAGNPTGHAAMAVSDTGAMFSHIVLADDPAGKRALLAAVLGHLHPPLWPRMAEASIDRVGPVGHCQTPAEAARWIETQGNEGARRDLAASGRVLDTAKQHAVAKDYAQVAPAAAQAQRLLADAYLRSHPSPAVEGRAWWNHSGTGAYPGDWEQTAVELERAGFNMVVPNLLWAGRAHYASDVLPRSATFARYGDQVAQCVDASHKHGIEVHVWKVNYNLSGAPAEFVDRLRSEGRTQVSVTGEPVDWLCPSDPRNVKLEADSMIEVAEKYDVDGLHFDYIRYPNRNSCYCEHCRRRFERDRGKPVPDWPDDCHDGPIADEFTQWRCRQITALVRQVHDRAEKSHPSVQISAAVFGTYPDCRRGVLQDWVSWIDAGLLDFVCPMDYTGSDAYFTSLVERQMELVDGRIPLYPGIGATASRVALSADRVAGQVHHARRLGADGFTIFNLDGTTAGTILPGLGSGVGATWARTK